MHSYPIDTSAAPRPAHHVVQFALAAALSCALIAPALADPFVPKAGHGTAKFEFKNITADRKFTGSFGTATQGSGTGIDERRLQLSGEYGLGNRWALQYELRASRVTTSRKSGANTGDQFGEQQLTFVHQLFATARVAHGVGLDFVVVPGFSASAGAHYALAPEYQFATRGEHGAFTSFMIGPRVYPGGHGTLLRAEGAAGRRLSRGLASSLTFVYSATLGKKSSPTLVEYNVLRTGVYLRATRGRMRPEIGYERNIAGQGIHAAQHVDVGLSMAY